MDATRYKSGFTLVEMLTATVIFSLVVGGIGTFMIGAYRMTKGTFAMATLSVQQREIRERMLFRAAPVREGVAWPGMISGANDNLSVIGSGEKIQMSAVGVNLTTGAAVQPVGSNIRIARQTSARGGYFVNEGDETTGGRWLRPLDATCVPDSWVDESTDYTSVFVTLGGALDGVSVTNRVVVPRFGVVQPTPSTNIFKKEGN